MTRTTHGLHKSPAYRRWIYMKSRCVSDPRYVAAGITVCDRWKDSFSNFYADMGDPPPGKTLDRIDGTKGYSPDNCRWASYREQNRNLKNNVRVGGDFISDIAERAGVARQTVEYRLAKGLDLEAPSISKRDHCKAGHEWTEANTYITKVRRKQGGFRTQRFCRQCRALHQQSLRARKSE